MSYAAAHAEVVKTGSANPGRRRDQDGARPRRGRAPGRLHRLPRSEVDAPARDAPGVPARNRALADSAEPTPHIQSIERWRKSDRARPYDPNVDASRQELRSFVCGQCHVEYYCGPKTTLFFPWNQGLKVEQIERTYDAYKFPDGHRFYDWQHAETGAEVLKAQHPEFELWSQGIHARSGVACADCHMPYQREGAMKVSDHWVRSPLLNVSRACQVCHPYAEAEILARVAAIQDRTHTLLERAATASTDMLDAIVAAKKAGATAERPAATRLAVSATRRRGGGGRFRRRRELDGLPCARRQAARNPATWLNPIDFARQAELDRAGGQLGQVTLACPRRAAGRDALASPRSLAHEMQSKSA